MISQLMRFKTYWPALVVLALIAGLCLVRFGYWVAEQQYSAEIARLNQHRERERREAADIHSRALQAELDKQQRAAAENQRLTAELLSAELTLRETQEQLKRSINDAITNDGVSYSGLGPDGLRLFIAAFGYPTGTGSHPMSEGSGGTVKNAETSTGTDKRQP